MPAQLPVAVHVDSGSGHWSVDGVAMILVPRHLVTNNLAAAEGRLGASGSAALIHEAGYRSAQQRCRQQGQFHGFDPDTVLRHYLEQLGRRGWGRLSIAELDLAEATHGSPCTTRHSPIATPDGRGTCYMFAAWLEGAFDVAAAGAGRDDRFEFDETDCRSTGPDHCTFHGRSAPRRRAGLGPVRSPAAGDHQ